jgi:hypothetical protein
MADYGAVGVTVPGYGLLPYFSAPSPSYADVHVPAGVFHAALREDGILAGNVKTSGINEPYVEVMVMWRPTMTRIARTFTDTDGNWELSGFDPTRVSDYAIIYKDPATGATFNDAIYALVVPA